MSGDPTENIPWREGENYDEMMSEEPFDEEEGWTPKRQSSVSRSS